MLCVFLCSSSIESCILEELLGRSCAGLEAVEVGHLDCLGYKRCCVPSEDLVALHIVVLQVQAVRSPSLQLQLVVSAEILHCTALVAAAEVADHSHHSLVVVKVLPEAVDSLNNPAVDSPGVAAVRSLVEEEVRSLEVGEVHSLEAGIVAVVDSHVADPGQERRT